MENDQKIKRPLASENLSSPKIAAVHGESQTTIELLETDEITLRELILKFKGSLRYLLSKWRVIFIAAVLGAIIGLTYAWFKKPVYTASTTFVLEGGEGGGSGLSQYSGLASMVGIDVGGGSGGIFQGDNIIELYKSRKMIEKALLSEVDVYGKKQLLIDKYIEFNNLRKEWDEKPGTANVHFNPSAGQFNRIQDSLLGETFRDIQSNYLTVAKPDKKLSIIKVEVKAKDEDFAKLFNEQIVKNVNDFYVLTKTKRSLQNVQLLQQKADSVRAVMNGAIFSAARVLDATPNLNITRQTQRAAPVQRSQFSAETNKVILAELVKNLEMSKIALHKETPLIQVVDEPVLPLEKETFGKVKAMIIIAALMVFLTVLILLIKRIYINIMSV